MYTDQTQATVIADSIYDGVRLVTFRATFPRFILAEFNTHRAFSRNSASSRAIPVKRQIELVRESPFVPQRWPINQRGMHAAGFYDDPDTISWAESWWDDALSTSLRAAESLDGAAIHKQIASRLLEPFMWHTVIVSSTMPGLDNFFLQRDHEDAQPEMQTLAKAMRKALEESTPCEEKIHLPFREDMDIYWSPETMMIKSVARCARVSYGRELEEKAYEEDVDLVTRLWKSGHFSPFEHVSAVQDFVKADIITGSNFAAPWVQLRHHWKSLLPTIAARIDSE